MGQRNKVESIEDTISAGTDDTAVSKGTAFTTIQAFTITNDGSTNLTYKLNSVNEVAFTLWPGETYTSPVPLAISNMWISNATGSDIAYRIWLFGNVES